ncbi:MAG: HAMP domain-containing histidine kinase [Rhodospirillaceae bacterium]|nr:HAMP domain-containing histidine kinase [Rhodospirillaceae bacterium]
MAESTEPQTVEQARAALKKAEAALEHALGNEKKIIAKERQRLGELAHEINTPLNAMIGYTHIMAEELLGPAGNPKYQDYAKTVYRAAMHLQSVCEGILSTNADAGVSDDDLADVDVSRVIDGVLKLFAGMAEERGIVLSSEIEDGFPILNTDPRRLNQILINLVSNAIKYTPRGGSVAVQAETRTDSGAMVFVVADNGQGMAPETLRKIAQPHRTTPGISPHGDSGSGMGLSIASRLIDEIRGDLWLASEEGVGTLAAIELPISFKVDRTKTPDTAVILEGKSILDFAPHRAIHKKD